MSCCGKKRATAVAVTVERNSFAAPAGAALRGQVFEYMGGSVLTVTGQGTGLQYRFVGHGARVSVDARDRASLARLPQLREIPAPGVRALHA